MAQTIGKGFFITLEGIEGAGKSTHQSFLTKCLRSGGHQVVETREPGGTQTGEAIRNILLSNKNHGAISDNAELLLMFAARAQHLDEVIRPNLANGITVISDRFTDSSFAYQGGGRGLGPQRIQTLQQWLHADLTPDLTLLLDVSVETGLQRVNQRGASDRFETERLEFFNAVRACYLERAAAEPDRFVVVDAERPIETIQAELEPLLKDRGML